MLMEDLEYYQGVFVQCGKIPPSPKQFAYVKKYLECGDKKIAYDYAGYASIDRYPPHNQASMLRQISDLQAVKLLQQLAVKEWAMEQQINARALASKALQAYENADNVRDQLNALKFIGRVMGYT